MLGGTAAYFAKLWSAVASSHRFGREGAWDIAMQDHFYGL
jgi:hypothetical protein